MELRKWMDKNNLNVKQFAQLVYVTKATVYCWLSKSRSPSRIFLKRILEVTDGEVTGEEWK